VHKTMEDYPHVKLLVADHKPVDFALFEVGDVVIEDRSKFIGTDQEQHYDKPYPKVELEILEVHLDLGTYWMWNITRQTYTVGDIMKMNNNAAAFKRSKTND